RTERRPKKVCDQEFSRHDQFRRDASPYAVGCHLSTQGELMSIRKILPCIAAFMALARAPAAPAHDSMHGEAGNAVTRWNGIAIQVLPVDPGLLLDSRAFAIMHAAIHDAVNGVERRYQPYTADLSSPGASVEAAVAAAARDVLVALSPTQQGRIDLAYAVTLATIPEGAAKTAGIALGQQCALA